MGFNKFSLFLSIHIHELCMIYVKDGEYKIWGVHSSEGPCYGDYNTMQSGR
jgi:hypothetical protein